MWPFQIKLKPKPPGYWTFRRLKAEAALYSTRTDFARRSPSAYSVAAGKKILDLVVADLPGKIEKWSFDKAQQEALKYTNRKDFNRKSRGASAFARATGIYNLICQHMRPNPTYDNAFVQAMHYKTLKDWVKAPNSMYRTSIRKGWIKQIKSEIWGL